MEEKPIVDKQCTLQKFPGKGGWTYAPVPEIPQAKQAPFGWVTVRGRIDDYEFRHFKLMPMGNGQLFFSVNAKVRKQIGKQAGDQVRIVLYPDLSAVAIPPEILDCFASESPKVYQTFLAFTDGERKAYLDWIYDAQKEDTQVARIVKMMERLQKGLKLYDDDVLHE